MAEKQASSSSGAEEEVWIAISAFEQILEAMPTDRASLEVLAQAYEQIGDHVRAKEYLIRLGNVLIEVKDRQAASSLAAALKPFAENDAAVVQMCESLVALSTGATAVPEPTKRGGTETAPAAETTSSRYEAFNLADELSFAWTLMESNQLSQDEYASVVQDLTEMSSGDKAATASVLHALEFRTFKGLERLMGNVSKECGTPIVTLSHFDLTDRAMSALPTDFVIRRGALVFDFIGDDALVVVMNPYDKQLRQQIESIAGKACHYFVTLPSEFDAAVNLIRNRVGAA